MHISGISHPQTLCTKRQTVRTLQHDQTELEPAGQVQIRQAQVFGQNIVGTKFTMQESLGNYRKANTTGWGKWRQDGGTLWGQAGGMGSLEEKRN